MKAVVWAEYGPPDVLQLKEVARPTPKDDDVLVGVRATSVNWADLASVRGRPFLVRLTGGGLRRPKNTILGADLAGWVEAVGRNVRQFRPGDEVFGDVGDHGLGAFAQYVCVPENALALKPNNVDFEEAAAAPLAASVALQGLRDSGRIQPGQRVLIIGASGGIGTFALQIAKSFGAEVTGVCSTRNLDLVRSIGADWALDYTKEDFARKEQHYDVILDIVANRSVSDYMRALRPTGIYVACAFSAVALFVGPVISAISSKKVTSLIHKTSAEDLVFVKELLEAGKVVPVIDKRYPLSEVAEAIRHYGEGHPQGKVVVAVEHGGR